MTALPTVRAPRGDLAALFDGRPIIVADSRLPDGVALHDAGARLCRATFGAGAVTLRLGPVATPEDDLVALDHAPAGVIALVTPTPRGMTALAEWWQRHGAPAPLVVVAEGGLAALPALLRAVLAASDRDAARICGLERQLAELRAEAEDLRGAVAALLNTPGGHPPPTPELRLETPPDPAAPALRLVAGAAALVVEPGLPSPGIARVSIHLAEAATVDLSVRLIGAESGRVLAAWQVPAAALAPGWLHLDTPEPLTGRAETVLLSLAVQGKAGEVPLSRTPAEPDEPALAFATLPPGARLVQPLHMDWLAWHDDAPAGIPRLAPSQTLEQAVLEGPGALGAEGGGRRLDLPEGWGATRIALGPLPEGCAAVRCDIALEGAGAEARLVLDAAEAATDWRLLTPGPARVFALPVPGGAPALAIEFRGSGASTITLRPPVIFPALPAPGDAPLALPAAAPAPPVATMAPSLRALEGPYPRIIAIPDQPHAAELGGAGLLDAAPPDAERMPVYGEVVLDAHQSGATWELLDLRLRGLAFRGERWRELKFKFGTASTNVILEFRRAPSWPRAFETWPGTEADAYGDKFVLMLTDDQAIGLDRVAPGRDGTLVAALAAIMPRIVAEVMDATEAEGCAAAAERLAERLGTPDPTD